jgi:hypothetical protein
MAGTVTQPIGTRTELVATIARELPLLCQIVGDDVGETPDEVEADVALALRLLAIPSRGAPVVARAQLELMERGDEAARDGVAIERLLDRIFSSLPAIWDAARALEPEPAALNELGSWMLRGADVTAQAVTEGYMKAERAIVARDASARRAFVDELLASIPLDAAAATRLRRLSARYGLDPGGSYRLVAVAEPPDLDEDGMHALADRLAHRLGVQSAGDVARAGGLTLPLVLARHGRIVVLARADWPGLPRLREVLDESGADWIAVAGGTIVGVEDLAVSMARLSDTLRAAERMRRPGWIEHPDELAVERLLLLDDDLLEAIVRRELGPILAVPRMGDELVETLRVYFEAGENMRETARRMHLASRTVAYRLERISDVMGRPMNGEDRARLSVALLAYRALNLAPVAVP